jgi:hypothetical protein
VSVTIDRVVQFFNDADWKTWLGHGLLGALIAAVGVLWQLTPLAILYAVFAAFFYREASDLLNWRFAPEPKPHLAKKIKDGFFDLVAPLIGAGIAGALLL